MDIASGKMLHTTIDTRRMFVIETASRACKITILIKRSKVRKVNHAFLPEGIQIEDLTRPGLLPCLVSQLALLAE